MIIVDKNELYHHGIKGQKWGVRRYQNADGTYTQAGKKRRDTTEGYSYKKTSLKEKKQMTDEELLKRIGRLEKEKKLGELERYHETGRKVTNDILVSAGKKSATVAATAGMLWLGKKGFEKYFGDNGAEIAGLMNKVMKK